MRLTRDYSVAALLGLGNWVNGSIGRSPTAGWSQTDHATDPNDPAQWDQTETMDYTVGTLSELTGSYAWTPPSGGINEGVSFSLFRQPFRWKEESTPETAAEVTAGICNMLVGDFTASEQVIRWGWLPDGAEYDVWRVPPGGYFTIYNSGSPVTKFYTGWELSNTVDQPNAAGGLGLVGMTVVGSGESAHWEDRLIEARNSPLAFNTDEWVGQVATGDLVKAYLAQRLNYGAFGIVLVPGNSDELTPGASLAENMREASRAFLSTDITYEWLQTDPVDPDIGIWMAFGDATMRTWQWSALSVSNENITSTGDGFKRARGIQIIRPGAGILR